jgi:hypothetical protein
VPLHPARQTSAELAVAVVDKRDPVVRHGPKLHC